MNRETVLVTGAAGFIGPQVVKLLLEKNYRVIVVDKLTYAARVKKGKPLSLEMVLSSFDNEVEVRSCYFFVNLDVCNPKMKDLLEEWKIDYVIHMAAESHVDRAIEGKSDLIQTEIFGTYNILETIRFQNSSRDRHKVKRAVFISTDEVYGSIDRISGFEGDLWYNLKDLEVSELINRYKFTETTPLSGGSPYAACKGGADLLAGAYYNTFKWNLENGQTDLNLMPVIITRGVNNFGYFQHPEKLIPMVICSLLQSKDDKECQRSIPIYDKGLAVREWLRTEDYASAIIHVMRHGNIGEVYNVGSGNRFRNRDLLLALFRACKKITKYNSLSEACFDATTVGGVARPGHDLCYSVDCSKIYQLGWQPQEAKRFDQQLKRVVDWYVNNEDWWKPVWLSEDFTKFWDNKYRNIMSSSPSAFEFYTQDQEKRKLYEAVLGA